MLLKHMVIGAALTSALGVAHADSGKTTTEFVTYCAKQVGNSIAAPETACACGAGVMGGVLNERQYSMLGLLLPYIESEQALVTQMQSMIANGYSAQEILTVAQTMQTASPQVDRVCSALERPGPGMTVSLRMTPFSSVAAWMNSLDAAAPGEASVRDQRGHTDLQ